MKWRWVISVVVLVLLNTITALGIVQNQYGKRKQVIEVNRMHQAHDQMLDRRSQLLVELAAWSANSRIERVAREELNMKYEYRDFIYLKQ